MHCLMAWLFKPDTLHYGAYVMLSVYRLQDRIEATVTFQIQTNLKINAVKGRTNCILSLHELISVPNQRNIKGAMKYNRK